MTEDMYIFAGVATGVLNLAIVIPQVILSLLQQSTALLLNIYEFHYVFLL